MNTIRYKKENFDKNHKTVFCQLKFNPWREYLINEIEIKFKIPKKQINIQTSSVTNFILNMIKINIKIII